MARSRISPSLVISCVALAVALGGTAYAVTELPKDSVGAKQLRANAVRGKKVKDKSLAAADVKQETLAFGTAVTVSAFDFHPRSSSTDVDATAANGCIVVNNVDLEFLSTPLSLPQGAKVRTVTFYFLDNSSSQDMALYFTRYRPKTGGKTDLIHGRSIGQSQNLREWAFKGNPITVVNNSKFAYLLQVSIPWPTQFVFCGARVQYTLD